MKRPQPTNSLDAGLDVVGRTIAAALEDLLTRGFQLPIFMTVVGVNGSTLVGRYDPGETDLDLVTLAEHYEPEGFLLPINMMFVDSATGNAARVFLRSETEAYTIN